MKHIILLCIAVFISGISYSQASTAEADRILGTWLTGSGKGKVKITRYGDKYAGEIVWIREPNDETGKPKTDIKNPDPAKRSNPRLGLGILLGFTYEGNGKYENGTIYDPENGKTYKCNISLENGDKLNVRGYVGFSLIGRTDVWTRTK